MAKRLAEHCTLLVRNSDARTLKPFKHRLVISYLIIIRQRAPTTINRSSLTRLKQRYRRVTHINHGKMRKVKTMTDDHATHRPGKISSAKGKLSNDKMCANVCTEQ